MSERYGFGANWASFVERSFTPERREAARRKLLDFLGRSDLKGERFLDIGSGSGLHSLAAHDAGARAIHSFDYDLMSVETTRRLAGLVASPSNWRIERGDILDQNYIGELGRWELVYSWGVLHHTGSMWRAITNAASLVAPGGQFFVALYSTDVVRPSKEFWLEVKHRYNRSSPGQKRRLEAWYVLRYGLGYNPLRLPGLLHQIAAHKSARGMSYMTDVRDWLGGLPMEFAGDQETVDFLEERHGFVLRKISRGEANTEFLFENTGKPGRKTTLPLSGH